MKLGLQFGHGMMEHCRVLISEWGGGSVVLSPRDLTPTTMAGLSKSLKDIGARVLLDPQCFARDMDHQRLAHHSHLQEFIANPSGSFHGGKETRAMLSELAKLNKSIGAKDIILPIPLAAQVDDDWLELPEAIIAESKSVMKGANLIQTIALSNTAVQEEAQIEAVVERAKQWDVDGFYIVLESPSTYLVDDAIWLGNLLLLASGLKLLGKEVIVGYCSHQMLCLAAANVDEIFSGTWLNVRSFHPTKFYQPDPDDVSRQAIWYYCPQVLSEFKLPYLDIAQRMGKLGIMKPDASLGSSYANALFTGARPTTVNWRQPSAFRHYLTCLHSQVSFARKSTYEETKGFIESLLNGAEVILGELRKSNVFGGDRDFLNYADMTRAALAILDSSRGSWLRRNWK